MKKGATIGNPLSLVLEPWFWLEWFPKNPPFGNFPLTIAIPKLILHSITSVLIPVRRGHVRAREYYSSRPNFLEKYDDYQPLNNPIKSLLNFLLLLIPPQVGGWGAFFTKRYFESKGRLLHCQSKIKTIFGLNRIGRIIYPEILLPQQENSWKSRS